MSAPPALRRSTTSGRSAVWDAIGGRRTVFAATHHVATVCEYCVPYRRLRRLELSRDEVRTVMALVAQLRACDEKV
jgi:hypothetical protein